LNRVRSGGAQAAIAVGQVGDLPGGRRGRALLSRLAIDDIRDFGATQAEIRQNAVVEGVELGESPLPLAPGVEAIGNAAEKMRECRYDTVPFK
jgi:hypothetical protein